MPFCENCGSELEKGCRFCENCGAAVGAAGNTPAKSDEDFADVSGRFTMFQSPKWQELWRSAFRENPGKEPGLIVTREAALLKQLNAPGNTLFRSAVGKFIYSALERGVAYYYLDFDLLGDDAYCGQAEQNIAILRKVIDTARPKYLFILGNESVIDVCSWENQSGDDDAEVWGDFAYATLDGTSPWEGQTFNFQEALRVGRLPNAAHDTLADFCCYFERAAKSIGHCGKVNPYGLSAFEWRRESLFEYSCCGGKILSVSPATTVENFSDDLSQVNLLYFNLHGSDSSKFWYGQQECLYPKAFSPELIARVQTPCFLGVEACYGSNYSCNMPRAESILLTALHRNCLAFLGSSAIAYGSLIPEQRCGADIIVGEWLSHIGRGECAGDAFLAGLKRLTSVEKINDTVIKTLAEFSLYGDPSASMSFRKSPGVLRGLLKGMGGFPQGIHIPMPDVRRSARLAAAETDGKINAIIDEFVRTHYLPNQGGKDAASFRIRTFKVSGSGLNQRIYYDEKYNTTVKVYFDNRGNIKETYISK